MLIFFLPERHLVGKEGQWKGGTGVVSLAPLMISMHLALPDRHRRGQIFLCGLGRGYFAPIPPLP